LVFLSRKKKKASAALAGQGKSDGLCATTRAKRLQPVVLPELQGKGPVRQRSLPADLIYSLVV